MRTQIEIDKARALLAIVENSKSSTPEEKHIARSMVDVILWMEGYESPFGEFIKAAEPLLEQLLKKPRRDAD